MTNGIWMPQRRDFLRLGGAVLAAPALIGRAAAAQTLSVRTPGGAFDDVKRRTVYDPFKAATGIEIVPVAATVARLLAMSKSGRIDIDCIDTGADALMQLELEGALTPIDYKSFTFTNPDDIDPAVRTPTWVASYLLAFVMTYNTASFPKGKEPKSWADFWDLQGYPGARTMAGMGTGTPNLEFALLADGVAPDKLYPLDIPRALKSLSKIKASIPKFWDTGALSAQMMADKEAVLGSLWNTRVQGAIDAGAPLAIQWNQNLVMAQAYGIAKGSPKVDLANKFIDYSLSPEVQVRWLTEYQGIPANMKAYPSTVKSLLDPDTKTPWTKSKGIPMDNGWWAANRPKVSAAWSNWIL